jgi:hypothetical protein
MTTIDIGDILKIAVGWIGANLPGIKMITDIFKSGLDSTKAAQDIFRKGNEDLQAAVDHNENIYLQRAQSASELLRSYAWFGAIEACFKLGMAAMIVWLFRETMKNLYRSAKP